MVEPPIDAHPGDGRSGLSRGIVAPSPKERSAELAHEHHHHHHRQHEAVATTDASEPATSADDSLRRTSAIAADVSRRSHGARAAQVDSADDARG